MIKKLMIGFFTIVFLASAVQIQDRKMVDQQGRQMYFHGTNVVVKVPPYIPRTDIFDADFSFNEQDMANCKKWGINAIRLGIM